MIHAIRNLSLALAAAALVAGSADAQRSGQGGRGQGGPSLFGQAGPVSTVQLLMARSVQQELGLSEEQTGQLSDLSEQLRQDLRSRVKKAQGELKKLPPQKRQERFQMMVEELEKTARAKLRDVLDPKQMQRLTEIRLQQAGVMAFAEPAVREELGFNDQQRKEIDGVISSFRSDVNSLIKEARGNQQQPDPGRFMQMRRSSMKDALGVLTEEQTATWKKMTGEPLQMGRGGRGQGGQGGQGRGQGQSGQGRGDQPGGEPPTS